MVSEWLEKLIRENLIDYYLVDNAVVLPFSDWYPAEEETAGTAAVTAAATTSVTAGSGSGGAAGKSRVSS